MRLDGYMSPISLNVERITQDIREQHEQNVLHAVMQCGINVDRDELIKALSYDRDQYLKGFRDGIEFAKTWISVTDQPEPAEDGVYWCYGYWFGSGRKQCETAEYFGEWKIVNNFILTHWMPLPKAPETE